MSYLRVWVIGVAILAIVGGLAARDAEELVKALALAPVQSGIAVAICALVVRLRRKPPKT